METKSAFTFAVFTVLIGVSAGSLSAPALFKNPNCPGTGYTYDKMADRCYKILSDNKLNRVNSGKKCLQDTDGAHLVVVENDEQNAAIKILIQNMPYESQKFCRLSDTDDSIVFFTAGMRGENGNCTSDFVWKMDLENPATWFPVSSENTHWFDGQPVCANGESCLVYKEVNSDSSTETKWASTDCALELCSICEVESTKATTENQPTTVDGNDEGEVTRQSTEKSTNDNFSEGSATKDNDGKESTTAPRKRFGANTAQ